MLTFECIVVILQNTKISLIKVAKKCLLHALKLLLIIQGVLNCEFIFPSEVFQLLEYALYNWEQV